MTKPIETGNFLVRAGKIAENEAIKQIIELLNAKRKDETIKDPIVIKRSKLNSLEKSNENLVPYLELISPFVPRNPESKTLIILAEKTFGCKEDKVRQVTLEDRKRLVESGMIGVQKTFKENIHEFLPSDYLIEEVYEEQRLKFLIEKGKDPFMVPMEDYEYLESEFLKLMNKVAHEHFLLPYDSKSYVLGLYEESANELLLDFYFELVKRFTFFRSFFVNKISKKFHERMRHKKIDDLKVEYKQYKVKLLSYSLHSIFGKKGFVIDRVALDDMTNILWYFENVKLLADKEEMDFIVSAFLYLVEHLIELNEKTPNFTDTISKNESGAIESIFKKIPIMLEYIHENY